MNGGPSFVAYVDESGDEGFKLGSGSSEWFVLAAVVLRRENELEQVKLIDDVRQQLNSNRKPEHQIPSRKPLHFRDLRHEPRKFYAARIAQADLRTISVLVCKSDLASPESFSVEPTLYHYAVRLLLERVSWYCRDNARKDDSGDGSTELVFSNRAGLNGGSLGAYLTHLETHQPALEYRAAPGILRLDQISTYSHGRRMGLQLADAVASSYFYAVEPSPYGLTEDGYARLLLPRAYRHEGALWGYGVKLVPREAEEKRRAGEILGQLER